MNTATTHNHNEKSASTEAATTQKTGNSGKTATVAETPKAATTVENLEKKTGTDASKPAPKPAAERRFRILEGVPVDKFRGQRKLVVTAMQKLAGQNVADRDKGFTLAQIAENTEGLVSKTPLIDSVKFHLNGLLKDKEIEEVNAPAAPVAETAEAAK